MSKRAINPESLVAPKGFNHGWLVSGGDTETLYLAGQCAYDLEGRVQHSGDLVGQMDLAMRNIGEVLKEAGMTYEDVLQLNFYVLSRDDYSRARKDFGRVWKGLCGKHFPAMAMFMVSALYEPEALIEIQGIAARAKG
ncbi:MAG: RidA family protein [Planctomycetota bacterium]|jgi:enamine deaminase RidA (YjgF/YER057c/UK114 family)